MRVTYTCLSPLHHGAFGLETGNASLFRRMPLVGLPGMPAIPCISGNAVRGVLRRIVFRELFHRAGVTPDSLPPKAWDRLYAACCNGGHLTGKEQSPKTEKMRELRSALPPLSVFGASLYTWMLSGHFEAGIVWPRCEETRAAGLVSGSGGLLVAEDLVHDVGLCRHVEREQQDPEITGVTPMPTTLECLGTGTVLEQEITFAGHATEVERAVIVHALQDLDWVGGKRSTGFGRVRVELEQDASSEAYTDWLASTGDLCERIVAFAVGL